MKVKTLVLLGIIVAGIVLGACREFVFLNLNYQIDFVRNHRTLNYAHSIFQRWVAGMELDHLLLLKWTLGAGFALIMCGLAILLSHVLFGDHRYATLLFLGFLLVGTLATIFHYLAGSISGLEGVSIKLLHLIQYPVLLFFIWAGSLLQNNLNTNRS